MRPNRVAAVRLPAVTVAQQGHRAFLSAPDGHGQPANVRSPGRPSTEGWSQEPRADSRVCFSAILPSWQRVRSPQHGGRESL